MTAVIKCVTFDCADRRGLSAFWTEVTSYQTVAEEEDFVALAAPDHRGVRGILFWRVFEPKPAESRMHFDLATENPEDEIERFVALCATKVEYRERNGSS